MVPSTRKCDVRPDVACLAKDLKGKIVRRCREEGFYLEGSLLRGNFLLSRYDRRDTNERMALFPDNR